MDHFQFYKFYVYIFIYLNITNTVQGMNNIKFEVLFPRRKDLD